MTDTDILKAGFAGILITSCYLLGFLIGLFLKAGIFVILLAFIYLILAFFGVVPPVDYVPIIPFI